MRLAVLTTHPIQYYGPLFRELAQRVEIEVLFAHRATGQDQARAGFGLAFDWDLDITAGYPHRFLTNVARTPDASAFMGCDTPEVGDVLQRGRFQAVLLTGWGSRTYLQGLYAGKRLGLPVVVRGDSHLGTPRSWMRTRLKAWAYPAFLRRFDTVAYVGERSRAYYAHFGYPESRLFFSPHCVDNARFAAGATVGARASLRERLGIRATTPVALMVGKLIGRKRPLDLVWACALCRARGLPLEMAVAGSGPLEQDLADAAARAGVPLHRLGFRNQTELPQVYAAADCLVLASDVDTWGLVANEALASNRPIVVSDACGCVPDLTRDPAAGLAYPMGDIPALAAAIMQVMTMRCSDAPRALSRRYGLSAAVDGIEAAVAAAARRA